MSQKQQGFTILELMIATAVFSLVLMVTLAGIMQITKMYYRGVTLVRTQEATRSVVDELGEAIRFSVDPLVVGTTITGPDIGITPPLPADTGYFCLGSKRYTYAIDRQLKSNPIINTKEKRHVLWVDQPDNCTAPADLNQESPSVNGVELLAENMRLSRFQVSPLALVDNAYVINIGVAYGDDDLLFTNGTTKTCEGAFIGAEFCAVSNLSVTVGKRL